MELRNLNFRVPTWSLYGEGHTGAFVRGENTPDTAESREPVHAWKSQSREPGDPIGCWAATSLAGSTGSEPSSGKGCHER